MNSLFNNSVEIAQMLKWKIIVSLIHCNDRDIFYITETYEDCNHLVNNM